MEAGDTRLCDSVFRKMYCGFGNDGQVPWAKAVFYSHLGCSTDNTLVYQLLWVAHLKITSLHMQGGYSGSDFTENISELNKIKCNGSYQNNLQRTVIVLDVELQYLHRSQWDNPQLYAPILMATGRSFAAWWSETQAAFAWSQFRRTGCNYSTRPNT